MNKKPTQLSGKSLNPQEELHTWLRNKLPEAFTEGKIDCQKLKATLGETVDTNGERYGLCWAGKSDCFHHIQEPTTATLRPLRDESVEFDKTKNLFIEGDNLQVLKVLQKSYYGQVKMIYIDPPYNTGSDSFIYPDRFQETQEEYMERVGDKEEGHVTRDGMWQKNSGDNGHYHSNWLSMMYPRLFLARNLLRDDGVIFVSIDDNEVKNLRAILDEIFGENNFVATFVRKRRMSSGMRGAPVSPDHEYVLCYAKSIENVQLYGKAKNANDYPYEDSKGKYRSTDLTVGMGKELRPNQFYAVKNPRTGTEYWPPESRVWRFQPSTMKAHIESDNIIFPDDNPDRKMSRPRFKTRFDESGALDETTPLSTWINSVGTDDETISLEAGLNQEGTKELRDLFENAQVFDYPKPVSLIQTLVLHATRDDDVIMDFFAGSGTTPHAVISANVEDQGNRIFISVQFPEPIGEETDANKFGLKTISDIAKERIRRAGKKLARSSESSLDIGFKVFSLDESNFKIWRSNVADAKELAEQMHMFIDNLKAKSTQENVLYELILKSGLDLNVSLKTRKVEDIKYYVLDGGKLIVSLEDSMTQALADAVIAAKPQKVICLDGAFKGNDQLKTNTALQMEAAKIDFRVI